MIEKFTIDRNTWYRGNGSCQSKLLVTYCNKKCCLGFFASACGYTDSEMRDVPTPTILLGLTSQHPNMDWLTCKNSDYDMLYTSGACLKLVDINDNMAIESAQREQQIKEEFAKQGIEVQFVN